jgi:ActD protein
VLSRYLIATYHDETRLLTAIGPIRDEHFRIHDVFAPYPVHGLDEAMAIRRTRLPWVTFAAGLAGLAAAVGLQVYASVLDWPMNVGGKPDNSALAFVPISFELTVLFAGLVTVAAFFLRARLYPGRRESLADPRVTDDVFALVVRKPRGAEATRRARELLLAAGAVEVAEREADL